MVNGGCESVSSATETGVNAKAPHPRRHPISGAQNCFVSPSLFILRISPGRIPYPIAQDVLPDFDALNRSGRNLIFARWQYSVNSSRVALLFVNLQCQIVNRSIKIFCVFTRSNAIISDIFFLFINYELKLLALSKLSNSRNIYYNMSHLLSQFFFQNRHSCGWMKQDISVTISQVYP